MSSCGTPEMTYDLIYIGDDEGEYNRIKERIESRWPDAQVEDGSDEIHGYRLSVSNVPEEGFYRLMFDEGLLLHCLGAQLKMKVSDKTGFVERLKKWIDEKKTVVAE